MGVRRAMEIVLDQANRSRSPVMTRGPLIHNPQVIEALRERGIGVLSKEAPAAGEVSGTVVVRAHGITPSEKTELLNNGYNVVDATCPHVIRIQKLIDRHVGRGDSIIIVGDHGHAEVNGLLGHAQGGGYVVANESDVAGLPPLDRVCVVSQTTQNYEHFDNLLAAIRKRWPECSAHRTICASTDYRQKEAMEIAAQVDAMIIVGGRESANTVRLAELAAATGTPTFHIEKAEELDYEKLRGRSTIGVTAGASTPNWMIVEVTERLQEYARRDWGLARRTGFTLLSFLLDTNLILAIGAICTGYGCAVMQGINFPILALIAAGFYIFAMYSLNIQSQSRTERYSNPLRWRFHDRYGRLLLLLGAVSLIASLVLSGLLVAQGHSSIVGISLMFLASIAGLLYRIPIMPGRWFPKFRYHSLIDLPGSKDLFMGLAWAVVLTIFPLPLLQFATDHIVRIALTFFFVFTLVFIRSVVFDLRDIQGDQIIGRETIPMVLGKERTRILLVLLTGLLAAAIIGATWRGILSSVGYLMVLPLLYTWGYLYLYHRRSITRGVLFEIILDGNFILVGLLAVFWHLLTV